MEPPLKRPRLQNASIRKRAPLRPAATDNDIYITRRSKAVVVIKRVQELLLDKKLSKVTLHALGAAILPAVTIAQSVQKALHDQVDLKPTTSTHVLVDDIVPNDMDQDLDSQKRMNSVIHIELVPREGLKQLQQFTIPMKRKPGRNRYRLKKQPPVQASL